MQPAHIARRVARPRRRDSVPATDCRRQAPQRQRQRTSCKRRPSLRRPILKPRKIAVKGDRYARVASRRPLTASLVEDSEAPIGGKAQVRALTVAPLSRFIPRHPRRVMCVDLPETPVRLPSRNRLITALR